MIFSYIRNSRLKYITKYKGLPLYESIGGYIEAIAIVLEPAPKPEVFCNAVGSYCNSIQL